MEQKNIKESTVNMLALEGAMALFHVLMKYLVVFREFLLFVLKLTHLLQHGQLALMFLLLLKMTQMINEAREGCGRCTSMREAGN